MKFLTDCHIRKFIYAMAAVMAVFSLVLQVSVWVLFRSFSAFLLFLSLAAAFCMAGVCFWYFYRQNQIMETAVSKIHAYLAGDQNARIDCDYEGEMYKLFHSINTLAAVLNAHAQQEQQSKEFLKNTISDISHQLKTPIAALNIYNGLLQGESEELPEIQEFVMRSEQELDRIEILVQNLLKITKLDAHSIVFEKKQENVADMMKDIALHFSFRAGQERKEFTLSGGEDITLFCDRGWLMEAVDNIIKNAFDHTKEGDLIAVSWKQCVSMVQITVEDTGSGIYPEDLYHIFKRFYRSRFSQDVQGIGLGLPLAKAIIEAHEGTVEVDSQLGAGTTFVVNFLIPTKLQHYSNPAVR